MIGGNIDNVTNQSPFYDVKDEREPAEYAEKNVESYTSMRTKHKTYASHWIRRRMGILHHGRTDWSESDIMADVVA